MSLIKELVYRLRGEYTTEKLIKMGMKVGGDFGRLNGVILDPSHCWLINWRSCNYGAKSPYTLS